MGLRRHHARLTTCLEPVRGLGRRHYMHLAYAWTPLPSPSAWSARLALCCGRQLVTAYSRHTCLGTCWRQRVSLEAERPLSGGQICWGEDRYGSVSPVRQTEKRSPAAAAAVCWPTTAVSRSADLHGACHRQAERLLGAGHRDFACSGLPAATSATEPLARSYCLRKSSRRCWSRAG